MLPIQNGLGSADRIAAVLGDERVAIGVAGGFGASMVGPGHVHHNGWELVRLGERNGPATPRIERIADAWADAGFRVQVYDDVDRLVWEKLDLQRLLQRDLRDPRAPDPRRARRPGRLAGRLELRAEAYEVARARGVALGFDDPVAYTRAFGEKIPDARPSMLLDLLAGRPCEIDVINGAIPPAARELGLAAPVNETVTALIKAKNGRS